MSRRTLLRKVTVRRTRQIGPRNRRGRKKHTGGNILGTTAKLGRKLGAKALASAGLLKKGLGQGVKAMNSDIGKTLADEGIKHTPELYHLGTIKISNKNVKKSS